MSEDAKAKHIETLIKRSADLSISGDLQGAASALREALHIDPANPRIKEQLIKLRDSNVGKDALGLVEEYLSSGGTNTGKKAAAAASRAPKDDADKILTRLLDGGSANDRDYMPKIVGAAVHSQPGQTWIAKRLADRPTETFCKLWERGGNDAIRALVASLLKPGNWTEETQRSQAESDVFKLLIAKLIEAGVDAAQKEIAMGGLARLIAVDAPKLADCIERDTFDVLFSALDVSNSTTLRSQATLAIVKVLEAREDEGKKMLKDLVVSRIARQTDNDLTIAFSAAAAVFPILPELASEMFLAPGFVQDLVRLAEAGKHGSSLRRSGLELLSNACVVKECRALIAKDCVGWLRHLSRGDQQDASLAALVLSKLELPESDTKKDVDDLLPKMKKMAVDTSNSNEPGQNALEAMAYRSMLPKVKEELASDRAFLKNLFGSSPAGQNLYAMLTLLKNLTFYKSILSPEEQKLNQLRAYANQSKPQAEDPLDSNSSVDIRCKALLDADIASFIFRVFKSRSGSSHSSSVSTLTPGHLSLIAEITLSLSRNPKTRGTMAQSPLFDIILMNTTNDDPVVKRRNCLSLARLIEATDPSLIFRSQHRVNGIQSTLEALKVLVRPLDQFPENLDQQYYGTKAVVCGLHAMTNMLLIGDVPERLSGTPLDSLWMGTFISRIRNDTDENAAFVEYLCNLCHSESGCQRLLCESDQRAKTLIGVLIDKLATKQYALSYGRLGLAAGGCLHAMLVVARDRALHLFLEQGEDSIKAMLRKLSVTITWIINPTESYSLERQKVAEGTCIRLFAIIDECLEIEKAADAGDGCMEGSPFFQPNANTSARRMFLECGIHIYLDNLIAALYHADLPTTDDTDAKEKRANLLGLARICHEKFQGPAVEPRIKNEPL
ncbi:MAG: hypothetical protein M1831_001516 [Alyxoria varia]|nr:MAG: hypothetical protein M1831_001516 [Alyxoria varia]